MNQKKLSIVVPAYNMEDYIARCLDSIFFSQEPEERYEVIVVNDGSKDKTQEIVNTYLPQHRNLSVISQENQGLSAARNAGLERVTGDYVWFVDSDDAVTDGSITKILASFESYSNADFLIFDWISYYVNKNEKARRHALLPRDYKYYEKALKREKANSMLRNGVPWLFVYNANYLKQHHLRFLKGILFEDNEFRMRVFFFAKEVRFIPFAHYVYSLNRSGSISTEARKSEAYSNKHVDSIIKTAESWLQFKNENVQTTADKKYVSFSLCKMYGYLIRIASKFTPEQERVYGNNVDAWKRNFKRAFANSFSIRSLNPKILCRYFTTLYFPKYYEKVSLSYLKSILHLR